MKGKKLKKLLIALLIILLIAFLFPKKSYEWGSGIGDIKSCTCLGVRYETGWIGGAKTFCFGIIYKCLPSELLQRFK